MTERKTEAELAAILRETSQSLVRAPWVHEKSGRLYLILDVSLRESDLEPLVTYRAKGSYTRFNRPVLEFRERFRPATAREVENSAYATTA